MEAINNLQMRELICNSLFIGVHKGYLEQRKTFVFLKNGKLNERQWLLYYHPAKDAKVLRPSENKNPVRMSIKFNQIVEGRVIVEADALPTKTYDIPSSENFDLDYFSHKNVYTAVVHSAILKIKITVEVYAMTRYIPEIPSNFDNYNEIPTDFEIHCENKQYKVHKDVLSQISPVFEAMLNHNFVEKSSNKLEITDFEFQTVETAMNIIYDRSAIFLSVKMMMNILSFAGKYFITDLFDKLENVLFKNLTIYNFDVMLRCVEDIANQEYFIKFANFFKLNEDEIIKTEEFAALPRPLVIKLCKAAYQFKTELDVFFYMLETGIDIDLKQMPITTLPDFFKVISYATQHGNHEVYHAAILKFSPVFETRYKDYYLKKLEIPGFNFETVEAVLNTFYDWPGDEISVELAFDVLRLCEKYDIMHVFDSFEEVMERNLSPDNFFEVLQFAHDCTRRTLFAKSAAFYKINEDAIKNTEAFLALPGPLIVMLLKSAYNLETELDVFFYARDNGIHLDMEHIEVKTALDFFRSVPYAWHHHEENLKLKCAIFWRENKDILGRNPQYQQYPNSFEHELDVLGLGNDDFINDDIDDAVDVYGIYDMNFDDIDDVEDVDNDDDDDDDDDFFHL